MNTNLMFSSETGKWDTQKSLIDDLSTVFDWDLDVCASGPNVCENYYDESKDGLSFGWIGLCWMNPPYGRKIGSWIEKARNESEDDIFPFTSVVCLVPARTDTRWWHDNIRYASQVVFIDGRLVFGSDESWIASHQLNIMKQDATPKQLNALVKKIGGVYCTSQTQTRLAGAWLTINQYKPLFTFDQWLEMDHLKKDSAPFPSAFVVFGEINGIQRHKLATYGWSITQ